MKRKTARTQKNNEKAEKKQHNIRKAIKRNNRKEGSRQKRGMKAMNSDVQ